MNNYKSISETQPDVFNNSRTIPTAALQKSVLLFDNFNGYNPINQLGQIEVVRLWQITIFFVMQGSVQYKLNGESYTLRAGQRLTTLPNTKLEFIEASENIRFMMYVIYPDAFSLIFKQLRINYDITSVSGRYYISTLSEADLKHDFNIYLELKEDILTVVETPLKKNLVFCYLNVLIANNSDICNNRTAVIGDTSSRQYDVYRKFISDLNIHTSKERSVNFYAGLQNISAKYLSFVCIQYSGKNASSWIDEYVATKAKALINVHHMNTQQLCKELNFTSTSSFIRYFKRVTGMSPKEYSNSLKK